MKYNSPGKKIRLDWTKVPGPQQEVAYKAQEWCRANGSDKRFYKHYASRSFWFELESDALLFQLKWVGK